MQTAIIQLIFSIFAKLRHMILVRKAMGKSGADFPGRNAGLFVCI
jgi:hypothetical protein